jgi:hypothetical protein
MTNDTDQRIGDLWAAYQCEDAPRVEAYLRANPDLLAYVEESAAKIATFFPESDLHLSVELDEDEDGGEATQEKLFLLIEAPAELGDALGLLERLDEEWSVDVCEATGDRLVIDLKY